MKALRILGVVLGGLLVIAAIIVGLALLPAVQTWAVRKAVSGQAGLSLDVGRVAVGLSQAQIDDLKVSQDGAVIVAKRVLAQYSAWSYLTKGKVDVDLVSVEGVAVDLSKTSPKVTVKVDTEDKPVPAAAAKAAPAFAGLLNLAQLPMDVRVAKVSVQARVALPNEQSVDLTLQGGDIETGRRGRLEWKVAFADARKAADIRAVRTAGTLLLHISDDRRIDDIELSDTTGVEGTNLPSDTILVTVKASQAAKGADENYTAAVALVRGQKTEPLLNARVKFDAATRKLSGTWDAAVRSEQLAELLAGLGLPETAVDGAGSFTFHPDSGAATVDGEIKANLAKLEKLSPSLAAVGGMKVRTAFAAALANDVASLKKLEIDASSPTGKKLLEVATRQNVSFNVRDKKVSLVDPAAELAVISVQGLPLAWAQPMLKPFIIDGGEVSLRLSAGAEADGSKVRVRTVEPLTVSALTLREGDKKLVDRLSLSVAPQIDYDGKAAEVTAVLDGLKVDLAAGDAVRGKVSAQVAKLNAANPVVTFSVKLQEKIVSVLKPYSPVDPGVLAVETNLGGRLEGRALQLSELNSVVKRDGGALLVAVELLQPLNADLAAVRVTSADGKKPALRVRLGEVPFSWGEAFVPKSKFAGGLAGGSLEVVLRSLEDLELRTVESIALRGVGAKIDGQELAREIDVALDLAASKKGDAVSYDLRKLTVQQKEASLLRVAAAGDVRLGAKLSLSAKGTVDADIPTILKQPVLVPYATIARGNCNIAFDVAMAEAIKAAVQVKVRQLTAVQGNKALGDIDVSVDGTFKTDGSGTARIPLTVTLPSRRSDVTVEATVGRAGANLTFNGKVVSKELFVDDLQALAVLAPQSSAPAAKQETTPAATKPAATRTASADRTSTSTAGKQTTTAATGTTTASTTASTRDTEPFWKGAAGRIEVTMDTILYGADYRIKGVKCAAKIDDKILALENFEGRFNDNPFKVGASVSFAADQAQPYTLASKVKVDQFDVGAFLQAANPKGKPQLETKVSVDIQLNGRGATVTDLGMNAYGKFDVTGSAGVLRALGKRGETVGTAAKVLGLVGALRGSDGTVATAELAAALNEMSFDRFTMHAERGADLAIKLSSLEFISPTVKLTGTGSLANKAGVPIDQQALQVVLQLAGKDSMAVLLNKAGMLSGEKDAQGYYLMSRTFELGGTPSQPDSSQLWKILGEAGLKAGIGAFLK